MGIISFSIPHKLVESLSANNKVTNFIETGTFKGNTAIWAAGIFKNVYTIEIFEEFSKAAAARKDATSNIEFIVGNSKTELPKLASRLKGKSMFWLDGHWCSGAGGKDEECPLIDELIAISKLQDSIILIDDARCFLGPLPPPHNAEDWPRVDEIFSKIASLFPNHHTTVIDDVIVSVPTEDLPALDKYWQASYNERYYNVAHNLKNVSKVKIIKYLLGMS